MLKINQGNINSCIAITTFGNRCSYAKKYGNYCGFHKYCNNPDISCIKTLKNGNRCKHKKLTNEPFCNLHSLKCIVNGCKNSKTTIGRRKIPTCELHRQKEVFISFDFTDRIIKSKLEHMLKLDNLFSNFIINNIPAYIKITHKINECVYRFNLISSNNNDPDTVELKDNIMKASDIIINYKKQEDLFQTSEITKIYNANQVSYFVSKDINIWPFIIDQNVYKIQKTWRRYKLFFQRIRLNKIKKIQRWWTERYYKPGGKASIALMNKSMALLETFKIY